jgi:hypothetical protein
MKKIQLRESKVLRSVRKIKETIAREAQGSPEYYQRLNGLGARLLAPYRSPRRKTVRP